MLRTNFQKNIPFVLLMIFAAALVNSAFISPVQSQEEDSIGKIVDSTLDQIEEQKNTVETIGVEEPEILLPVSFTKKSLGEIFDGLEKVFGATIEYQGTSDKKITLYLEDARLLDAMKIIANLAGLAFTQEVNMVGVQTFTVISPQDYFDQAGEEFSKENSSEFVLLKFAKAADVQRLLQELKSDSGVVLIHREFNAVAMIDQREKLDEMLIMTKEIDVSLETEIFELNDLAFEDIEDSIRDALTNKVGRLQFDERSDSIIVTDTEENIQEIRLMIEELMSRDKNLKVDIKVLQITLSDEHIEGVDWAAIVSDSEKLYISRGTESAGQFRNPISVGSLSEEDFPILLEALDTVGVVSEVSIGKYLLLNGEKGDLILDDESLWKDRSINKLKRKIKNKLPLEFHFLARWKDRTDMSMTVSSAVVGQAQNIDGLKADQKGKNYASTIEFSNESTVVIGGVFIDKVVESTWKIPLLGDIPFLGIVFRSQGQVERKTEIIIFLTSHLEDKG